ncbi:MAG: alginate lyase family protein, partial [Planctomycetota bacterium]
AMRAAPGLATAFARRAAGRVPAVARDVCVEPALLRPCPEATVEAAAGAIEAGRFEFLGVARELGSGRESNPYPAPRDVSLLWAYHLEYMDYLLDLCLAGRAGTAGRLVRSRWATEGVPRRSATHPYPESRRVASWLRAWSRLRPKDRALAAEGAWVWACRVARNRETDVGGNHLLENGLALALAGAAFRGRRAAAMRRRSREIFAAGVREQVLPDGAHFELSPMYHARVLGVLLEGGRALAAAGTSLPTAYWETLARMAAFLGGVIDPRGELPLLGDTAREATFRPGRFLAAVEEALPVPVPREMAGDVAWPDCGLYRFEDREAGHRLLLDAGPVCPDRLPAHGQADTFGFELHVAGEPFVVDAGLHEYAAGPMRDWCRSTRAHSTVTVDGWDSAETWSSFRVGRRARVHDATWTVVDGRGTFSGRHDGFAHLGVSHARCVAHLASGLFLVVDGLRGRTSHASASRLHLHPEAVLSREGDAWVAHRAGRRLVVVPFGAERTVTEDGWHCPGFGIRHRSRLLRFDATGTRAATGYVLAAGDGPRPTVTVAGGSVRITRDGRQWSRRIP